MRQSPPAEACRRSRAGMRREGDAPQRGRRLSQPIRAGAAGPATRPRSNEGGLFPLEGLPGPVTAPRPHGGRPDVPTLFRVVVPVTDIGKAERFYSCLLGLAGTRVSSGRHYFNCGGTILACFDPRADTDPFDLGPNPDHLYLAVDDLSPAWSRALDAGATILDPIAVRPWGERSFYLQDPFGNKLCLVERRTMFTGRGIPGVRTGATTARNGRARPDAAPKVGARARTRPARRRSRHNRASGGSSRTGRTSNEGPGRAGRPAGRVVRRSRPGRPSPGGA